MLPSGDLVSSSIDFFDNVFTFFNSTVTVNCCHPNDRLELATCGLGASCAGSCSALGAKLCPSGDCTGDCEMPFDQDTNQIQARGQSGATKPSQKFRWCSARCNVWKNKGCCYNPKCRSKRSKACRWMNYLTGDIFNILELQTLSIQEKLALCLAVCPMESGVVNFMSCRYMEHHF